MPSRVHVIGAGLAGLSAAVRFAAAGWRVTVHEGAGHAGGRCRSFHDGVLDRVIDNGNHILLNGNTAALAYVDAIGAAHTLTVPAVAEFPFLDLESGLRWTIRPNRGRIPWWILAPGRRVPGSRPGEYLRALALARASDRETVAGCLDRGGVLFRRFWEPLALAILNTETEAAAAALLWPVIAETFGRGEAACRPRIARDGLGASFVAPALETLRRHGAEVRFGARLRALAFDGDRVAGLEFGADSVVLAGADRVVLAVPAAAAVGLVPDLVAPRRTRAIVNGHFRLPRPVGDIAFMGLVGGMSQWLFVRGDVASVTVSAADAVAEMAADAIAPRMWAEVARALGMEGPSLPPHRIVKEKRATFAQTPEEVSRRPGARTRWRNLVVAGDWTDTGLPATLEGAVRSGVTAFDMVCEHAANS